MIFKATGAMNPLEVVCAVIINQEKCLLACQRNSASSLAEKWEFPGGKIEPGESPETALKREILEELGVSISMISPLKTVIHQYAHLDFEILLIPYLCEINSAEIPQALEHAQISWINPKNAFQLDWADADQKILLEYQKSPSNL